MNRDEITALAAQVWSAGGAYIGPSIAQLSEFAALVAAKEREACAKLCEAIEADRWGAYKGHVPHEQRPENGSEYVQGQSCGADMCMDAIRAMGAR